MCKFISKKPVLILTQYFQNNFFVSRKFLKNGILLSFDGSLRILKNALKQKNYRSEKYMVYFL